MRKIFLSASVFLAMSASPAMAKTSVSCKHFPDGPAICHEPGAHPRALHGYAEKPMIDAVSDADHFSTTIFYPQQFRCWTVKAYSSSWASVENALDGTAGCPTISLGRREGPWQPDASIVHFTKHGWRLQYQFDESSIKDAERAGVPRDVFYGLGFYAASE